jgi:hypothetical protein
VTLCTKTSRDEFLRDMLDQGINLILPPRKGFLPGDLLLGRDCKVRRAEWRVVMGVEPARLGEEHTPFKSFDLKSSSKHELGLIAKIAGKALASLGLSSGKLATSLADKKCERVVMKLVAPALAELTNLDRMLEHLRREGGEPQPAYEDNHFYIVRGVWRARGVSLELYDNDDQRISVSGAAADAVRAEVGVALKSDAGGRLIFAAEEALMFGIEVVQLDFSGGMVREHPSRDVLKVRGGTDHRNNILVPTEGDSAFMDFASA